MKVLRFRERDIIRVKVREGYIQPFYRSTGRNSGMRNVWLPFDGILTNFFGAPFWFDKRAYQKRYQRLDRFGTEELLEVSIKLGQMNIPEGKEVDYQEINDYLEYTYDAEFNGFQKKSSQALDNQPQ